MRRILLIVSMVVLMSMGSVWPAEAETRTPQAASPVYLVMDVSGSMRGDKLAAAKEAARQFIDRLQPQQRFALFTYPSDAGETRKLVDGCPAGSFVVRSGAIDSEEARARVNGLKADGETPTVPALKEILRSADELGYARADVVLFTDGEANCGETNDVCEIVPLLAQRGLNLRISTVSLGTSEEVDAQLACLAAATGGTSVSIAEADDLIDALARASSYVVDLNVEIPDQLFSVTGRSASLASEMVVTIDPVGSASIPDAKLVVTFNSGDETRYVQVPQPVVALGNLETGRSRSQTIRLFPHASASGPITWTVSVVADGGLTVAKQSGDVQLVASSLDVSGAGAILAEATSVVVMGDSYSSGEGAGDYSDVANCHRSPRAYGKVLFPEAEIIACSGAVTAHLLRGQKSGTKWVPSQLRQLASTTYDGTAPDLVLMTLGGNNVGFGSAIIAGVAPLGKTPDDYLEDPDQSWASLEKSLTLGYRQVNAIVNGSEALASRDGKVAQIVVLAYVLGVPKSGLGGCLLGLSSAEQQTLYQFGQKVNRAEELAVASARESYGVPVQYVDSVADAFQPDHTACDEDSYLVTTRDPRRLARADQELMHPNLQGQSAVASSVLEWSRTAGILQLSKPAEESLFLQPPSEWNLPTLVLEPGSDLEPSLACQGQTCPWNEGQIWMTLRSVATPLGVLTVAADGAEPTGQILLPDDVEPGAHTLVFKGIGADGSIQTLEVPITVWRAGSSWGIYLVCLGSLFLLASAGCLRARRSEEVPRTVP